MTNSPIDEALEANEGSIMIDLVNKNTGTPLPNVPLDPKNTMGQIAQTYGADIGINPNDDKIIFVNKRTGSSTSILESTVGAMGLCDGDVLAIADNGGVAACE